MFKEKAVNIMTSLSEKVKSWSSFIKKLKINAEKEDVNVIAYSKFLKILKEQGISFNDKEKETVMQGFIANLDRDIPLVNISTLYSIKTTKKIKRIYDKMDMYEEVDNPDLVDNSGYFGIFYREKVPL